MKFSGWQVVTIVAVCVSPFWLLASNWSDMSELKASATGGVFAAFIAAVIKLIDKLRGNQ